MGIKRRNIIYNNIYYNINKKLFGIKEGNYNKSIKIINKNSNIEIKSKYYKNKKYHQELE